MKKILLLLGVIPLFNSCGRDNDNPSETSQIIGKWNYNKSVIKSGKDSSTVLYTENFDSCYKRSSLEFSKSNFTEILYETQGSNCVISSNETSSYTIDSNNNIHFDGESAKIISITAHELVLLDDEGYDYNHDGVTDQFLIYLNR